MTIAWLKALLLRWAGVERYQDRPGNWSWPFDARCPWCGSGIGQPCADADPYRTAHRARYQSSPGALAERRAEVAKCP